LLKGIPGPFADVAGRARREPDHDPRGPPRFTPSEWPKPRFPRCSQDHKINGCPSWASLNYHPPRTQTRHGELGYGLNNPDRRPKTWPSHQ
jgi:hypothetical protein